MPRYRYGTQYTPPAPMLPVRVDRPGASSAFLLSALLDPGADLSVLLKAFPCGWACQSWTVSL